MAWCLVKHKDNFTFTLKIRKKHFGKYMSEQEEVRRLGTDLFATTCRLEVICRNVKLTTHFHVVTSFVSEMTMTTLASFA
jgi:hypothetical protein